MNRFGRYFAILWISFKNYNVFFWDIFWKNIIYIIRVLVIIAMYKAIYKLQNTNSINYTLEQVSWWLIFVQALVTSRPGISSDISEEVKSWKIINYLLNPMSYISYKFVINFTQYFYNLSINLGIWFILWFLSFWWINTTIYWILSWAILLIWSMLIQYFAFFIIWLSAFYFEDVEWFRMIYNFLDRLFGWNILPIPFFPQFIQNIIYLSPFAYTWYTAWLIFSKFEYDKFLHYSIIMFIWIIFYILLSTLIYNKAKKHLVLNWW